MKYQLKLAAALAAFTAIALIVAALAYAGGSKHEPDDGRAREVEVRLDPRR